MNMTHMDNSSSFNICILSRKDLNRITRVVRQAKVLREAGHNVTVVSLGIPHYELRETTPGIEYLAVRLDPLTKRVSRAIRKRNNSRVQKLTQKANNKLTTLNEGANKKLLKINEKLRKKQRKSIGLGNKLIRKRLIQDRERIKKKILIDRERIKEKVIQHRERIKGKVGRKGERSRKGDWRGTWLGFKYVVFGIVFYLPVSVLFRRPGQSVKEKYLQICNQSFDDIVVNLVNAFRQFSASLDFAKQACLVLHGRKFHFCQAHDNYALYAAKLLAIQSGAKIIYDAVEISEHRIGKGMSEIEWIDKIERWIEGLIIRSAYHVITVGPGLARWYAKRYRIKTPTIVRNCRFFIPYVPQYKIRSDSGLKESDRLAVWFGYAYPEQGLEQLIESVKYMTDSIHIAIIATISPRHDEFMRKLTKMVSENRYLYNRVHFLRPRDPNELLLYTSGADIGVIPRPNTSLNIQYSLPNKLLEMIMARLPIATARLIDIVSLIEEYHIGDVFDETSPEDIARVIQAMLAPATYAALKANVINAAKELCWEKESEKYLAIFQ
jgi:glycosyltransferase involved in cell wall biosynthesis